MSNKRDRGGGGAGRAIALPLFCWGLFSRVPVDMENNSRKIVGLCLKRWAVRDSCFRQILENHAVLMEEWMFACPNDYNPMCVQG